MRRVVVLLLYCMAFFWSGSASAVLESLVMPGKLIKGHAKYEKQCEKCHEGFEKKSQRKLCLACHKDVAADVKNKHGYHGKAKAVGTTDCKRCHSDHIGRDADVVLFNPSLFDHSESDFKLTGKHLGIACKSCHKPKDLYRKAKGQCIDCHKKRDAHEGKLGKKCGDCHKTENWIKTKFDHDKTDFKLKGKHQKIACVLCHPDQRYKDVGTKCIDCHRIHDVHAGRNKEKCDKCHTPERWDKTLFDHDKKTKFPLKGKHRETPCGACHKGDYKKKKPGKKCIDCHKLDDGHKGRYGQKCKSCHSEKSWIKHRFDHARDAKYPLKGKHRKVTCEGCHPGEAKNERDKTACIECHRHDDVHQGKQGKKCGKCHNPGGWRNREGFDHDMTDFPLIGLHVVTTCEECHRSRRFGDEISKACDSCHRKQDVHKGRLTKRCEICHTPNEWTFWRFNHNKQTKFKLENKHKDLQCELCHQEKYPKHLNISQRCVSCHNKDDVHWGSFGEQCERCHNTKKFKDVNLP